MSTAVAPAHPGAKLRIGSLELDSPVLIAPMVGITDAPCRELAVELGAGLVSTEMVPSDAVVRGVGPRPAPPAPPRAVPGAAKMRLGWDAQSLNAPALARALADVGVSAVTVRGRTPCQGYSGN